MKIKFNGVLFFIYSTIVEMSGKFILHCKHVCEVTNRMKQSVFAKDCKYFFLLQTLVIVKNMSKR